MSFQSTRKFLGRKWCEKSRRNFKNDILKSNVLREIGTCFVPMLSIIIHRFLSSKCVEMPWRWKIIIIFIECIVDVKRIGFFGHFRVIDTITPLTLAINYFLTAKLYIYPFQACCSFLLLSNRVCVEVDVFVSVSLFVRLYVYLMSCYSCRRCRLKQRKPCVDIYQWQNNNEANNKCSRTEPQTHTHTLAEHFRDAYASSNKR